MSPPLEIPSEQSLRLTDAAASEIGDAASMRRPDDHTGDENPTSNLWRWRLADYLDQRLQIVQCGYIANLLSTCTAHTLLFRVHNYCTFQISLRRSFRLSKT